MSRGDLENRVRRLEELFRSPRALEEDIIATAQAISRERTTTQALGGECDGTLTVTAYGCGVLPLEGVSVTLLQGGSLVAGPVETDAAGQAIFTGLPAGPFEVTGTHPRFSGTASVSAAAPCNSSTAVDLPLGSLFPAAGYLCVAGCARPVKLPLGVEDGAFSDSLSFNPPLGYTACRDFVAEDCYNEAIFGDFSRRTVDAHVIYDFRPGTGELSMYAACCQDITATGPAGTYGYFSSPYGTGRTCADALGIGISYCDSGFQSGTGTCIPFERTFSMPAFGPHPAATVVVREAP